MELLKAYLFGLTLSFTVGPMTLLIVQRAITKGLKSAMLTSIGLALADWTLALIAFSIGASVLSFVNRYQSLVSAFSGTVLVALAFYVFWSAFVSFKENKVATAPKAKGSDFISAYVLTVHNPLTIAVFLGFIGSISKLWSFFDIILYATMVFLGSCTGQVTIGLISYRLRGLFKSPTSIFTMNVVSSLIIAIFGAMSFVKLF